MRGVRETVREGEGNPILSFLSVSLGRSQVSLYPYESSFSSAVRLEVEQLGRGRTGRSIDRERRDC